MNELTFNSYWNDIPTSRNDAVTYTELMMWWNTNEREVRRILHELSCYDNGDNYILIRSGKNKGFYKTDDKDTIEKYKKECLNKGRSVFAPVRKINRILSANNKQYSLINNLRLIREKCHYSQLQVCDYMKQFDSSFDVPMLSKMENSFCLPNPYQLEKLAELYECNAAELLEANFY